MNAYNLVDKGIKYVELTRGPYEVDGNVVELKEYNNKVSVVDFNSIKPITRKDIVCFYTTNGDDRFEVDWYKQQEFDLLSKKETIDLGDGDYTDKWASLEDEFAYRKFKSSYNPIYKNIEVIGDPIKFEIKSTVLDSGNPYIKSEFANGGSKHDLFLYNRVSALPRIVTEAFNDLNMEFKDGISYSQTANQKIWGNSTHSCIEYVTAFGGYLFTNIYKNTCNQRGTLEAMLDMYEKDKREITAIIKTKYNITFGMVDQGSFDFKKLLITLNSAKLSSKGIKYKQGSYNDYLAALSKLSEAITQVEQSFK